MASSPTVQSPSARDMGAVNRNLVRAEAEARAASTAAPIPAHPVATNVPAEVDLTAGILDIQPHLNAPGATPSRAPPGMSFPQPLPAAEQTPAHPTTALAQTGPSPATLPVPPGSQMPAAAYAPASLEHRPSSSTAGAAGCAQEASATTKGQLPDVSAAAVDGSRPVSPISLGDVGIPLSGTISAPILVGECHTVSASFPTGKDKLVCIRVRVAWPFCTSGWSCVSPSVTHCS